MEAFYHALTSTYHAMFWISVVYALFLQITRKSWERRYTWATVVGGVALVGLVVRWRYTQAPRDFTDEALLNWAWWEWTWHFCAACIPIIAWQSWQDRKKIMHALGYRRTIV